MKKTFAIIFILILIVVGAFFYFRNSSSESGGGGVVQSVVNFFPNAGTRTINVVNSFFGGSNSTSTISGATSSQVANLASKFQSISQGPISGATLITIKNTKTKTVKNKTTIVSEAASTSVWYVDRTSGYVFSIDPSSGIQTQLSNSTKPGTSEVIWGAAGGAPRFILRSIKGSAVENYLAAVSKSTQASSTIGELSGAILNPDISGSVASPDRSQYFYLLSSANGAMGYIGDFSGKTRDSQVFTSSFPKWNAAWPETNTILLQSAPLSNFPGLVYTLNLKTKAFTKILGGINGLTALMSPDGKKILYAGNDLSLHIKFLGTNESDVALNLVTLPEKCVWTKDSKFIYCPVPNSISGGEEPDSWYQGLVSFNDSIWSGNISNGSNEKVYSPAESSKKMNIDGTNLFLSAKEDQLFLTDKRTGILWMLSLVQAFSGGNTTSLIPATTPSTTKK